MDRAEARMIAEEMASVLKSSNIGGTGSGTGTSIAGDFTKLTNYAGNILDAAGKMASGTYNLTQAVNDSAGVLKIFGSAGGALGDFVKGVGQYGIEMNQSLNSVSKYGFNFGQNLGEYADAVTAARMSIPEFQRMVESGGLQIAGLGGNAKVSAEVYLDTARQMHQVPLVQNMNMLGIGFDEFNKTLALTSASRRSMDMRDLDVRRQAVDAAVAIVEEQDNIARLTGRSRQEQQRQAEDERKRTDVKLLEASMSPEERAAYEATKTSAGVLGEVGTTLTRILATGGPIGADERQLVSTFDPTMRSLLQQSLDVKGDSPEAKAQRALIQRQIEQRAEEMSNDRPAMQNMMALFKEGSPLGRQLAESYASVLDLGMTMRAQRAEYEEAKKAGTTTAKDFNEFRELLLQREKDIKGKAGTAEDPQGPGARPAQLINQMEGFLKDINSGAAQVFKGVAEKTGQTVTEMGNLNTVVRRLATEEFPLIKTNLENWLKGTAGVTGVYVDPTKVESQARDKKGRASSSAGLGANIPGLEGVTSGNWWEDFGKEEGINVHGIESIVSKSNASKFIRDNMALAPDVIRDLQADLLSKLSDARNNANDIPASNTTAEVSEPVSPMNNLRPTQSNNASTEAMNDVANGINNLNMLMGRLINVVEEGTDKNVRAVKSRGNMLA
jgi:hypothetical protein